MTIVDWVIVVVAALYAVTGFRNGAVVGAFSLVGFFGGALIGAQVARPVSSHLTNGRAQVGVAVACVLVCAILLQVALGRLGWWLRSRITWQPDEIDRRRDRRPARRAVRPAGGVDGGCAARVLALSEPGPRGRPVDDRARDRRRDAELSAECLLVAPGIRRPQRLPARARRPALDAHRRRPAAEFRPRQQPSGRRHPQVGPQDPWRRAVV